MKDDLLFGSCYKSKIIHIVDLRSNPLIYVQIKINIWFSICLYVFWMPA